MDYGHAGGGGNQGGGSNGGGSSGSGGGDSSNKDAGHENPQLSNDGMTVNGQHTTAGTNEPTNTEPPKDEKPGGSKNMPNPVDGTGEGVDKDWWRNLPNANPFSIAEALRSPLKVDEREGTPILNLGAIQGGGGGHLIEFLTPQPIEVEEGGEGILVNLGAVHSTSMSSGSGNTDGWGDKPRTMAEAVAAPRIRGGAATARF